ncbi:MAG: phosphoribosylamine--glycine ligase [Myxococcaceae bacterium]|nr:phosphoribosylamine--glycine ligase [Myxococcaceae bacterium]
MKVLLLGSGAREHALAWKLAQSPLLTTLHCAPGNAGMAERWPCQPVDLVSPPAVVALVKRLAVELVVVGPEAPLVAGVADALKAAGIAVFGPVQAAAMVEGSKIFSKELMQTAGLPTAKWEAFDDLAKAEMRARSWQGPVVVKADGLAAGKGVVVADNGVQGAEAVRSLGQLGAGKRLILEERLTGPELSLMVLTDGEHYALLAPSQDHKRVGDGDTGPNTGGMGAYAPAPLLSRQALERVAEQVIAPMLRELKKQGSPFVGALYAGLMLTPTGPQVIEFNCRLGDPETQVLMMQLDEDLLGLMASCTRGELVTRTLKSHPGVSVAVVLAAQGYPEAPVSGAVITGLEQPTPSDVERFHAGTARKNERWVVNGGRVLSVCAHADSLTEAQALAYREVARISFAGGHFRRDIGAGGGTAPRPLK